MKLRMACCLVLLALSLGANAQKHNFSVDPSTGSLVKHKAVIGSLPFDKSYEELSAEEQQLIINQYENFPESNEPPFPLEGLKVIHGPIFEAHNKLRRRGRLMAVAIVDEMGVVQKVSVYESPSKVMSKVAYLALINTRFKPGICSGKPCQMEYGLSVNLN